MVSPRDRAQERHGKVLANIIKAPLRYIRIFSLIDLSYCIIIFLCISLLRRCSLALLDASTMRLKTPLLFCHFTCPIFSIFYLPDIVYLLLCLAPPLSMTLRDAPLVAIVHDI
jgi:hypothetical protein